MPGISDSPFNMKLCHSLGNEARIEGRPTVEPDLRQSPDGVIVMAVSFARPIGWTEPEATEREDEPHDPRFDGIPIPIGGHLHRRFVAGRPAETGTVARTRTRTGHPAAFAGTRLAVGRLLEQDRQFPQPRCMFPEIKIGFIESHDLRAISLRLKADRRRLSTRSRTLRTRRPWHGGRGRCRQRPRPAPCPRPSEPTSSSVAWPPAYGPSTWRPASTGGQARPSHSP